MLLGDGVLYPVPDITPVRKFTEQVLVRLPVDSVIVSPTSTNTPSYLPSALPQLPTEFLFRERKLSNPDWRSIPPSETFSRKLDNFSTGSYIIAIVSGVRSNINTTVANTPILSAYLHSFLASARMHFSYRLYFAYDTVDEFYSRYDIREKLSLAILDSARRSPTASNISLGVYWLSCSYTGRPAWSQSDGVIAAYRDGADYAYRTNDDSIFPARTDWVDQFIHALRSHELPNVGVVGPRASSDPPYILTHDFTHRTHAAIFGFHYPRSLPNWSADDWVGSVYDDFDMGLRQGMPQVVIYHARGLFGTRYRPDNLTVRMVALNEAIINGQEAIKTWVLREFSRNVTARYRERRCC